MDRHFLKFWGEFLLQAADGQRRMEDFTRWVQSGFDPSGALADLFRKSYGLPPASSSSDDLWRQALDDFYTALKTYAPLWGWVPWERYDRLKRKVTDLEHRIADQDRLIEQLEALLAGKDMGHAATAVRFQNLIDDQQKAFDKLLRAMTAASETPDDPKA